MALSAPVKALALLLFLGGIAGATYGVSTYVGDTVESQLVTVSAAHLERNATPGHDVTYVISVTNRDVASRDVSIAIGGYATGRSEITTVRGNSTVGLFVTVHVSENALPGEQHLDVSVVSNGRTMREREGMLTLRILSPAPGIAIGDTAEGLYVGRLTATGRVFNTNDPDLVGVPFAKTDTYRFSQGLLPIQTAPRPNVVLGLVEGILGMQAGESRTVSFGPEKAYGPATEEQGEPRDEFILRELTLVNDAQQVPRATFDTYVAESGQGSPQSFTNGSIFTLDQNGNDWPYRVTNMSPEIVEYKLAVEAGDGYTIYPFWANASIVTSANDTHVSFRTDPTSAIGETFTMKAHWPEMTALKGVNATAIVVTHTPPVGYTYTTLSQLGQPREATVKSVNETAILVAYPSQNPLAGKDLTFDVTLASITKR